MPQLVPIEEQLEYKKEFEDTLRRLKDEYNTATEAYQEAVAKAFRKFVQKCQTGEELAF